MSKVEIDGVEYECPPEVAGLLQAVSEERDELQGVKVKFDFFPDIGGVGTHPELKQAVMALMALVNNKFETAGKPVEKWSPRRGKVCWI